MLLLACANSLILNKSFDLKNHQNVNFNVEESSLVQSKPNRRRVKGRVDNKINGEDIYLTPVFNSKIN